MVTGFKDGESSMFWFRNKNLPEEAIHETAGLACDDLSEPDSHVEAEDRPAIPTLDQLALGLEELQFRAEGAWGR